MLVKFHQYQGISLCWTKTCRTVSLYDILMTCSWFFNSWFSKRLWSKIWRYLLIMARHDIFRWQKTKMLLINSPISLLRDDINRRHFLVGDYLLFGFWLLQSYSVVYTLDMCLLGIPVFFPGPFGRVTHSAFTVSLILMREGNQLMWSQTPPKPRLPTLPQYLPGKNPVYMTVVLAPHMCRHYLSGITGCNMYWTVHTAEHKINTTRSIKCTLSP